MPKAKFYIVTYEDGKLWIDGIRRKNPAPELLALMKTRWRATVKYEDGIYSIVEDEKK